MIPEDMAIPPEDQGRTVIRIVPATLYGLGWRLMVNVIPLALVLSTVLVAVFLLFVFHQFIWLIILIVFSFPSVMLLVVLPLGCNIFFSSRSSPERGFFVQLSLRPRRYHGLMGTLEDADDFGFLRVEGDWLVFRGNSIFLRIHGFDINFIDSQRVPRALRLFGPSIRVELKSRMEGISEMNFHVRQGLTVWAVRRFNRKLVAYVRQSSLPWSEVK